MFLRPIKYFADRFHKKQELAWLAYKGGLDVLLRWGRRTGKSDFIAEVFIEDIEQHGKDCMYIALTQGQAREIMWEKLVKRIGERTRDWKSNESRLEWKHQPSGAVISLKGADLGKDRLRGSAKRVIAKDEKAFWKDPSIDKEVLIPQLIDFNGQSIDASTPKGRNHFEELERKYRKDPRRYYASHATVFDNPFIPNEGLQKLLEEYAGTDDPLYRQEIMAEYIEFSGMVFALPQDSYVEDRWPEELMEHAWHWRGMDHGYSPDPTACLWMAYNPRKGYFQIYNEYKKSKLLIHQHSDVIRHQERYHFIDTVSDIDPQVMAEYEAVGLSLRPAGKHDKESRLLRLVNALKTGKLKIARNCVDLLKEMQNYEWFQDEDDHLIDAMNYVYTNTVLPEVVDEGVPEPTHRKEKEFVSQGWGDE